MGDNGTSSVEPRTLVRWAEHLHHHSDALLPAYAFFVSLLLLLYCVCVCCVCARFQRVANGGRGAPYLVTPRQVAQRVATATQGTNRELRPLVGR